MIYQVLTYMSDADENPKVYEVAEGRLTAAVEKLRALDLDVVVIQPGDWWDAAAGKLEKK